MLYGINYRSFHTAIHGIALFPKRKDAEQALEILKSYANGALDKGITPDELSLFLQTEVYDKTVSLIDEINYRFIEPLMKNLSFIVNEGGKVHSQASNVRIINPYIAVDVY